MEEAVLKQQSLWFKILSCRQVKVINGSLVTTFVWTQGALYVYANNSLLYKVW